MNHPTREEWVPYLFGEAKSDARRQLNAHLKDCPDCRQEIETWKMSLGLLDAWKLPPVPRPAPSFAPLLNWAAAAAVILLVGFGIGRLTAKANVQKVRAAIEPELRRELTQEFARLAREEMSRNTSATLAASAQQTEQAITVLARITNNPPVLSDFQVKFKPPKNKQRLYENINHRNHCHGRAGAAVEGSTPSFDSAKSRHSGCG